MELALQKVQVRVEGKNVAHDVSLVVRPGEIHALMGPNGSGKSSLAYAIAGHPSYEITRGSVRLGDEEITRLPPEERARLGLFLSFQEPPEVGGVSLDVFLKTIDKQPAAVNSELGTRNSDNQKSTSHQLPATSHLAAFNEVLCHLGLSEQFLHRFLNEGFSGGEKKKSEILQLIARKPLIAILDEIDTGLDVDALDAVSRVIRKEAQRGCGMLVISHSPRLLKKADPDFVHVLLGGRLAASGEKNILDRIEADGYHSFVSFRETETKGA